MALNTLFMMSSEHLGFELNYEKNLMQELIDAKFEEESKTMFGFPIKHLVLIAHWVRKNDITPEILKSSIESMKYGYDKAHQEIRESFENTFKTMKKEHTHE